MQDCGTSSEEEAEPHHPLQFKIVLLGAAGVGKTTIAAAAAGHEPSQMCALTAAACVDGWGQRRTLTEVVCVHAHTTHRYRPTVGVDFYAVRMLLPGDTAATAQLWDVGNGVSSLQMAANYVHGCDAVLMVHDLTRRRTLVLVQEWLAALRLLYGPNSLPYMALVGNKADALGQGPAAGCGGGAADDDARQEDEQRLPSSAAVDEGAAPAAASGDRHAEAAAAHEVAPPDLAAAAALESSSEDALCAHRDVALQDDMYR
jgi:GTPase SAR1 family protein